MITTKQMIQFRLDEGEEPIPVGHPGVDTIAFDTHPRN
jgi:hypothetical protein